VTTDYIKDGLEQQGGVELVQLGDQSVNQEQTGNKYI
jgi:hypothetical protein